MTVGSNGYGQLNVSTWQNIKTAAAGAYHTVGPKEDGTVLASGNNVQGQLNVSSWTNIKAVAADVYHTVGLKEDGTVVGAGYNGFGQLDTASLFTNIMPVCATQMAYDFIGFLEPVSLYKPVRLGSTIPVKFQLTDASGSYVSTATVTITIQEYSNDQPVGEPIDATSKKAFPLGELAGKIARVSQGQKVTYLTDLVESPENMEKAVELARDADHLFVEAAFLDSDRDTAKTKCHLTAKEAGTLARKARVKEITLFHFSPRYSDVEEEIRKEAMEAFGKG